jgi:hypothetical protein
MSDNEWIKDTPLSDLYARDARSLTDAELERFEKAADRDLMRVSGSMHNLPAIEAMRRLREAILTEERAIKLLTGALLAVTVALFVLAAVEFWRR